MVQKKTIKKTTPKAAHVAAPVVKKEESCACGSDCKCGCNGGCQCGCNKSAWLVFAGAVLIAASILVAPFLSKPCFGPKKEHRPAPVAPARGDNAMREFIKANPALIIETVNAYYQKQQAAQKGPKGPAQKADAAMVKEIVNDKTNMVLGNPKGTFVVIEFFDYQCGYCKMMNKKLAEAITKSDNIRWILIDAPIFGEKSEVIARYSMAAAKQGKFKEYHTALGDNKDMTEQGLIALGKTLGLNTDKLTKDANSDELKKKLEKNREYTKKLQMGGVPMFIIDGEIQGGAFPDAQLDEYVKKANATKSAQKAKKPAQKVKKK